MAIPKIIMKATLLAASIFWIIICSSEFDSFMIFLILLSFIPISICCALTILITIVPFFKFKKQHRSNTNMFKKYFPYYAITIFCFCAYGIILEPVLLCFCASAYFTTMQTWVWFAKEKETNTILKK